MYVPIMKNRDEEVRVIQTMNGYFNDSIIPMIEIYRDFYLTRYKTDEAGNYVYEKKPNSNRKYKIKLPPTDDDIITLKRIEEFLNGKKAFIDFFKFYANEYDDSRSFSNVELSIHLSRDFSYYKTRMLEIGDYKNLIPVISIKEGFNISEFDLIQLIKQLRDSNSSIAIRVTDGVFEEFEEVFEEYLTENDYLMLDIRNQNIDSKFIELEDFRDFETTAKKILLNSPRSRQLKNGDYEHLEFTKKSIIRLLSYINAIN
ncbi:beta family protein [Lysinibacillus sp. FN11]|uniref:beta family protein n=1 Tax=Lysinibacillus sp. FN11 TaxID=2968499 RepID=UPI00214BAD1C|nr:beta family protein [Lysinibacillus sp. FN11]UUV27093.1 beta family protein [Lysinibacillus sp. FN11]